MIALGCTSIVDPANGLYLVVHDHYQLHLKASGSI